MRSEARIELSDPERLATRFIDQMAAYEIPFEARGAARVADLELGHVALSLAPRVLDVSVEGSDAGQLEMLRSSITAYLVDFAEEPIAIRWSGAAPAGTLFTNFREMRVAAVRELTPRMRRLTLTGADISRFASDADIHVRLYIPPAGLAIPEWPRLGPDGRTVMPGAERCPEVRYYTVRRADAAAGEIDVDFLIHTPAGPGCIFATRATEGAVIGIAGPVGRTAKPAAWTLLAGDETALPAIARILETMPRGAKGAAVIEVESAQDLVPMTPPDGVMVRWLYRDATPDTSDRLLPAVQSMSWPDHDDIFVWAGCEMGTAEKLRTWLKTTHNLSREKLLVAGYWSR